MSFYRRNRVPGGTYFFTVNLADRRSDLLVREIALLRDAVAQARANRPFHIDAIVILPNHLHTVWTLPDGDMNFSARWATIKRLFTHALPPGEAKTASQTRRGDRGLWQPRFWEHTIGDERDYAAHVDYVHFNPVKHGLAQSPAAWPFSSFRRAVAAGHYPSDWAGKDETLDTAPEP